MESGTSTMLIMAGGVMVAVAIIALGTALKDKVTEVQNSVLNTINTAVGIPAPAGH